MKKEKLVRIYTFEVQRLRVEDSCTFRTLAVNGEGALKRLENNFNMKLTEFLHLEPIGVSKEMPIKKAVLITKERAGKIKKNEQLEREKHISLIPFPYLHEGLLRTMIMKLKKGGTK